MRRLLYLILIGAVAALWSCSEPKTFKISGEVSGNANTNLYVKYYGDGAVRSGVTVARSGKFETEMSSATPTLVEILDNEYNVLGRLYAQNGDELTIHIDRSNPALSKASGSPINDALSEALSKNATVLSSGSPAEINSVIEDYIKQNPDSPVGAILYVAYYDASIDPVHAAEVIDMISPEAMTVQRLDAYASAITRYASEDAYGPVGKIRYRNTKGDSARVFSPADKAASLLVISNENSRRRDSILPRLKRIHADVSPAKAQIIDFALFTDTITFVNSTRRDSAKWVQAWVPGGILGEGLRQLAIPQIPYYIVTNSKGEQKYRGASPDSALAKLKELAK